MLRSVTSQRDIVSIRAESERHRGTLLYDTPMPDYSITPITHGFGATTSRHQLEDGRRKITVLESAGDNAC